MSADSGSLSETVVATTPRASVRGFLARFVQAQGHFEALIAAARLDAVFWEQVGPYADLAVMWRHHAEQQTEGSPTWRDSMGFVATYELRVVDECRTWLEKGA